MDTAVMVLCYRPFVVDFIIVIIKAVYKARDCLRATSVLCLAQMPSLFANQ